MSWARLDDGFDDNAKVLALLDHEHGGAAIGLWTLCLAWTHRNTRKKGKVPGLIPASLPRRYLGPVARELAALLVEVGMWEVRDDGWVIHDFDQYLPTDQTRGARSEAGKRGAQARWGNRAGRDSKLPSDDSKTEAGLIANDGPVMAPDGSRHPGAGDAPDRSRGYAEHGKQPPCDSNLPSGLPSLDGNAMANDGSRAYARRAIPNGIAPTPAPIPVPGSLPAADVDDQSEGRNARATEDRVIQAIQQTVYDVTSHPIDALWADRIRASIADLAKDDDLGPAYFEKVIRNDLDPVKRFLEHDPPPLWCGECTPYRRLEDPETGDDLGRCPRCHPSLRKEPA